MNSAPGLYLVDQRVEASYLNLVGRKMDPLNPAGLLLAVEIEDRPAAAIVTFPNDESRVRRVLNQP